MLDKIPSLNTLDDLTNLGVELLNPTAFDGLKMELQEKQIVFMSDNYWTEDKLLRATRDDASVRKALTEIKEESTDLQVLHLLQLMTKCCPGISTKMVRLLFKMTC